MKKINTSLVLIPLILMTSCGNNINFNGMNEIEFLESIGKEEYIFEKNQSITYFDSKTQYITYFDYYLFEYNNKNYVMKSKDDYRFFKKEKISDNKDTVYKQYTRFTLNENTIYDIIETFGLPTFDYNFDDRYDICYTSPLYLLSFSFKYDENNQFIFYKKTFKVYGYHYNEMV